MDKILQEESQCNKNSLDEIDFSILNDKKMLELIEYATNVEELLHGVIWMNPHFRMISGQHPYNVEFKTIDTRRGFDYNSLRLLIYTSPSPFVFNYHGRQHFLPEAVTEQQPWIRDFSKINKKHDLLYDMFKEYLNIFNQAHQE